VVTLPQSCSRPAILSSSVLVVHAERRERAFAHFADRLGEHHRQLRHSLAVAPGVRRLLVPEYAGGHHERMDGKGYPKGLTREQMSVQARVMGIADVFEALTAKDRPYKKGKTLSESLQILGKMRLGGHVDPDLFDVFVRRKVYRRYADLFLDKEQIDEVDESKIPCYTP